MIFEARGMHNGHDGPVVAVGGLVAEARIAAGPGVIPIAGGGDAARLAGLLRAALERGAHGVVSFGIAGGLRPGLRPGTLIIARRIADGSRCFAVDAAWMARLAAALPHGLVADLAGVDAPVCDPAAKAVLHRLSGAATVDMESHIAARLAAQFDVPLAALRTVADPAERALPRAALVGMRPDGTTDVGAVLRVLARHPGQVPALVRTALDARAAFSALAETRRRLLRFQEKSDR